MSANQLAASFGSRLSWPLILVLLVTASAAIFALWFAHPPFGAGQIALAVCATGLSFWAVGQYDVVWHRTAATQINTRQAHRSGMAAVAIGQTIGASSVTSALARRVALPDLSKAAIAQVSAGVAMSFTACWALLALIAISLASETAPFHAPAPLLLIALGGGIAIMLMRLARQKMIRLNDAAALFMWCAIDLGAAGIVLFVLLPSGVDISLWAFLGAFVLAIGAGILSHLPGGIGVFELVLLALVPHSDATALMASIVAYRLIYYVVPFALAAIWLRACRAAPYTTRAITAPPPSTPASWGLALQSGTILSTRAGAFHTAKTPFGLVSIGDPVGARPEMLQSIATQDGAMPAIYKCSARVALRLRKMGWQVLAIAQDAVVCPTTWTRSGRAKQNLRRKLRQASDEGVTATVATGPLPMAEMTRVADHWARTHSGELGFSMGRYCPEYVRSQKTILIHHHDRLCGFVTFHRGPHDWTLDLMRHDDDMPSGAMHLAITTAIEAAADAGIPRLSLAAVPVANGPFANFCKGRDGLVQFKRSFDPAWLPLYHAAPTPLALWVTGFAITWAIHRPVARLMTNVPVLTPLWELSFGNRRGKSTGDTAMTADVQVTHRQRTQINDKRALRTS